MTDRIMLRAYSDTHTIAFRTVIAWMKPRQRFLICYEEFDRIVFEFTWLTGRAFDRVEGCEQAVDIRWSRFREFLDTCRDPDGPKEFKAVSLGPRHGRPRLIFDGSRANLKAAVADRRVRHKLGKALMANFNWPDSETIYIYNDFVPYSFFFREFRDGKPLMCGGLILHGREDMAKAYYGLHT